MPNLENAYLSQKKQTKGKKRTFALFPRLHYFSRPTKLSNRKPNLFLFLLSKIGAPLSSLSLSLFSLWKKKKKTLGFNFSQRNCYQGMFFFFYQFKMFQFFFLLITIRGQSPNSNFFSFFFFLLTNYFLMGFSKLGIFIMISPCMFRTKLCAFNFFFLLSFRAI